MQLDSLLCGKILLLELELRGQIEQAEFLFLFRDHFIEKCEMVAEKDNARGIVHLRIFADEPLKKDSSHRRDVLMAEAQIGAGKATVARLHVGHANLALRIQHMLREDFL